MIGRSPLELKANSGLGAKGFETVAAGQLKYGLVQCNYCAVEFTFENPFASDQLVLRIRVDENAQTGNQFTCAWAKPMGRLLDEVGRDGIVWVLQWVSKDRVPTAFQGLSAVS